MIGHFATLRMKGLNANPTKWPKSKQNCLSVFDHFVELAPKGSPPKYIYDICKKKTQKLFRHEIAAYQFTKSFTIQYLVYNDAM